MKFCFVFAATLKNILYDYLNLILHCNNFRKQDEFTLFLFQRLEYFSTPKAINKSKEEFY